MTADEALNALKLANSIITLVNPLLGGAIALGTVIAGEFRAQGANVAGFADEIAKFDAAVATGIAADDDWRARHGIAPAQATPQQTQQQPSPAPAQPSGGDSPSFPVSTGDR